MGDQNCAANLQPLAPASFYLLDSVPLHLILSEVKPRPHQCIVPSQPIENLTYSTTLESPIRESVNNPISGEIGEQIAKVTTKPASRANIISNEIITPDTQHTNLKTKELKSKSSKTLSKDKGFEKKQEHTHSTNTRSIKLSNRMECYIHITDKPALPRALAVLPKALHMFNDSIYPVRSLPPRVRFGPVEGVLKKIYPSEADQLIKEATCNEVPIFLLRRNEFSVTHINVTDKERSNWISLLPLGNRRTANVWLYEEDNELYGITIRIITSETPLALGYSKSYANEHNLSALIAHPVVDLEDALMGQPLWWCIECRRDLGSSTLLQQHVKVNHTDKRLLRRKYLCPFCSRTFSRLFTLRRHKKICKKKPEQLTPVTSKVNVKKSTVTSPDPELLIAQSTEEIRTPSDESFQNYTNALDLSINLFDPDRISNLDFSGSSKLEPEYNQYSQELKFDHLENNEDYTQFCKGLKHNKNKNTFEEPAIVTNKQTMTKVKKRRHTRECPARRLECECGKKFTTKEDFAKHVHINHNTLLSGNQKKDETDETNTKSLQYKCDDCEVKFKRRGMLVNHLWRVHNTKSTEVPLERRVRHYPCSVCPKIYSSAAKRDRHVQVHHPGARVRAAPIEGERRTFQPARCTACPREYVTKAKLLQHIRAQHPELAAQTKPVSKPTTEPSPKSGPPSRKKPTPGFY